MRSTPRRFDQSSLKPPLGSGPYQVSDVKPGEKIVYKRNPDYWAKDLPSKVGLGQLRRDFGRVFPAGKLAVRSLQEGRDRLSTPKGSPTKWARSYDFPAVQSGEVIKETFTPKTCPPACSVSSSTHAGRCLPMSKLRQGLALVFDFEWVNKNLFDSAYTRTQSFWQNSALSSFGVAGR